MAETVYQREEGIPYGAWDIDPTRRPPDPGASWSSAPTAHWENLSKPPLQDANGNYVGFWNVWTMRYEAMPKLTAGPPVGTGLSLSSIPAGVWLLAVAVLLIFIGTRTSR